MRLATSDFSTFFEETHGHPPFKWQSKLAEQVCTAGEWPQALNLPTAAGKTSVIDIAVFHLALESAKKQNRKAPMRIVFVVDRRLVVDDAFRHACKIAKNIRESQGRVSRQIAKLLKNTSFHGVPLEVVKIRGGMPQENDWVRTPTQPSVIISTVDQAGSRLLFRGYGVSDSMKPIHAGLLGSDVLYILDEAHTSKPFCDTLKSIQAMQPENAMLPFKFVFMSATLADKSSSWPNSKDKMFNDDKLQKRISAHKYAELITTNMDKQREKFVESAFKLAEGDSVKSIGVVVNRVKMARDVFSLIGRRIEQNSRYKGCVVHLLIGRARPLERDTFVKNSIEAIRGEAEIMPGKKVFFVATQCVEVGVDVSFDAMVTQIAPVDSLCQRFGRLNRFGNNNSSNAVIIAIKQELSSNKPDPVYGKVLPHVWKHLEEHADENIVDFGIKYFKLPEGEDIIAPRADTVTLNPLYLQFWAQTRPPPNPDPAPQFFLHGRESKSPDIQLIWRVDITGETETDQTLVNPPSPLEAVSIPVWTAKKWLSSETDYSLSDMEGVLESEGSGSDGRVVRWAGNGTEHIDSGSIKPGDVILVPSTRGGCDRYGWDDNSRVPVSDIGIEANIIHRRRLGIRLNEEFVKSVCGSDVCDQVKKIIAEYSESGNTGDLLNGIHSIEGIPTMWKGMLNIMKRNIKSTDVKIVVSGDAALVQGVTYKRKVTLEEIKEIFSSDPDSDMYGYAQNEIHGGESTTEEEYKSAMGTKPIDLLRHCKGVQEHVEAFGTSVGMNKKILKDIELAALLHDAGKAEKRVQALLRKQDPDELLDDKLIAKGTSSIDSKKEYEKFLDLARLPSGYRHECWSVNIARSHPSMKNSHDHQLVEYLIGTHHGYGRPVFPIVSGKYADYSRTFRFDGVKAVSNYDLMRIDSGWIEMVEHLCQKYGYWQLAYMEAMIRLADHRQSEKEASS